MEKLFPDCSYCPMNATNPETFCSGHCRFDFMRGKCELKGKHCLYNFYCNWAYLLNDIVYVKIAHCIFQMSSQKRKIVFAVFRVHMDPMSIYFQLRLLVLLRIDVLEFRKHTMMIKT